MGEDNTPAGYIILSDLASGKSILNKLLLRIYFSFLCVILACTLFPLFSNLSILLILVSSCISFIFFIEYQRKRTIICSLAVNLAHPWVEEEHDVDEAEVAYRSLDNWEIISREGRVRENTEGEGLLIDDGENEILISPPKFFFGSSIFSGDEKIKFELIRWFNLALAIRDAQNSVEDDIENARNREDDTDLDVERIWPATNPGELHVKPGAIFRNFSKVKK